MKLWSNLGVLVMTAAIVSTALVMVLLHHLVRLDTRIEAGIMIAVFGIVRASGLRVVRVRLLRSRIRSLVDDLWVKAANNSPAPPAWAALRHALESALEMELKDQTVLHIGRALQEVQSLEKHGTHAALQKTMAPSLSALQSQI